MDIINTLTEKSLAKYFDHTFLKAYATRADFEKLCKEARELGTAMVAINSAQVRVCKELLKGCDVHVGAAISFPLGQTVLEIKVEETKKAIQDGSDEIDYVINILKRKCVRLQKSVVRIRLSVRSSLKTAIWKRKKLKSWRKSQKR